MGDHGDDWAMIGPLLDGELFELYLRLSRLAVRKGLSDRSRQWLSHAARHASTPAQQLRLAMPRVMASAFSPSPENKAEWEAAADLAFDLRDGDAHILVAAIATLSIAREDGINDEVAGWLRTAGRLEFSPGPHEDWVVIVGAASLALLASAPELAERLVHLGVGLMAKRPGVDG
jgi:hypothetical protein